MKPRRSRHLRRPLTDTAKRSDSDVSDLPRAYLERLIDLMQENSINRLTIDWTVPKRSCRASGAGTPTLPETVGYVKVSSFSRSPSEAAAFANSIQRAIMAADHDDLIGWIVDGGNGGGHR